MTLVPFQKVLDCPCISLSFFVVAEYLGWSVCVKRVQLTVVEPQGHGPVLALAALHQGGGCWWSQYTRKDHIFLLLLFWVFFGGGGGV
jgi:hypothetical protein